MSTQQENAELIQDVIRGGMKRDAVLREVYKDVDLEIHSDVDGACRINVSAVAIALCRPDGTVWLMNNPDSQPYVGEVPVLLPLDQDAFLIAILYLGDLNALYYLRKKRMERISGGSNTVDKGFPPLGGMFS